MLRGECALGPGSGLGGAHQHASVLHPHPLHLRTGVHVALPLRHPLHTATQLATLDPYRDGMQRLAALVTELRAAGAPIRYLDIGGGLPVAYQAGDPTPGLAGYEATGWFALW